MVRLKVSQLRSLVRESLELNEIFGLSKNDKLTKIAIDIINRANRGEESWGMTLAQLLAYQYKPGDFPTVAGKNDPDGALQNLLSALSDDDVSEALGSPVYNAVKREVNRYRGDFAAFAKNMLVNAGRMQSDEEAGMARDNAADDERIRGVRQAADQQGRENVKRDAGLHADVLRNRAHKDKGDVDRALDFFHAHQNLIPADIRSMIKI